MDSGSEPKIDDEIFDLEAIAALKQSTAFELKENGNEYVKKGRKHYSDAIDCYTRAINQKALSDSETSILYSNRAHVNLLLGNHRRGLQDAEEAIKLCPTNVKALYRAVKASLSLKLLNEARSYCEKGLQQSPDNDELKKLAKQIDVKQSEQERKEAEVSKAVAATKVIVSAFEDRRINFGKAMYQELTGIKKPVLDKNNILHWPVLLLYAELLYMFSESSPPLPWDTDNAYTRDALELYYEANSGVCLPKKEILNYLLEGTAASNLEKYGGEETDAATHTSFSSDNGTKWVKINERRTLHDILKNSDIIVPGIPVFFVVSRKSSFYRNFTSGNWSPPNIG
ncbi:Tetratricopeptide repeat superfamily protein [Perilla frutescens var. hirtella]|uniref:Tetratricopeptide repeat superfamily protein n=1 Tax=Perilla frutescens var. hirtella TaxID=608512 RepID=A0AAD4JDT3_PERFH|nr:Tetratricopeptide repeat superfamily protein [Perilla frutescens var. hirtella]